MTLAEFVATGRDCADLGTLLSFDSGSAEPIAGRVYDGRYYIEDTDSWINAPADHKAPRKRWYLLIGRSDWFSDSLAELERRLYLYALAEDSEARAPLIEAALDAACKSIQDAIGQTDGGIAGHFFSDGRARALLEEYIFAEIGSAT